jgi:hypothetical protein
MKIRIEGVPYFEIESYILLKVAKKYITRSIGTI